MNRSLGALAAVTLAAMLGGCQYIVSSVGVQAALAGGGPGPYDPTKRSTDSQFTKVEGAGWTLNSDIHSATYSDNGRGLFITIFPRNGGAGGSKPDAFLVDVTVSNNDESTRGPLFSKQVWEKEWLAFDPRIIRYVSPDGMSHQPTAIGICGQHWTEHLAQVPEEVKITPGGTQCIQLIFAVAPPPGSARYQIAIPEIALGERRLKDTVVTFGKIHG